MQLSKPNVAATTAALQAAWQPSTSCSRAKHLPARKQCVRGLHKHSPARVLGKITPSFLECVAKETLEPGQEVLLSRSGFWLTQQPMTITQAGENIGHRQFLSPISGRHFPPQDESFGLDPDQAGRTAGHSLFSVLFLSCKRVVSFSVMHCEH